MFFPDGQVERAGKAAKRARAVAKAAPLKALIDESRQRGEELAKLKGNRLTLFTDDELYALLNALTFAVPTFDSHCEDSQQWAGEWKVNRRIGEDLKAQITMELRTREGT